jgi:outer membrane receptor protein involved in Fe transport
MDINQLILATQTIILRTINTQMTQQMQRIILIIFISLTINISYSQNTNPTAGEGIVSGKVLDKNGDQPMEYVSFRLFSVKDSSLVAGIFTDAEGKFLLENLPFGNYYGKFTYVGFLTRQFDNIKVSQTMKVANLGTIKLDYEKTGNLKEIKVTGQLDVLKAGIDKKVYNVAEDLSVRGGTANDILNNIPSVEVDQDGRVMLRGEGSVTVLIDGRPSSLSGGNGKSLLDALPAGSIERIEVVTNPSAKYDPDGTSGIINIVLKKNKLRGFNGLITTNIGSGNLNGGNVADGSASLSYRNSKLNVYGSYSARYMDGYRNNYSDLEQTFADGSTSKIIQNRVGTDVNSGNTFRLGSDFYLKARHILGVSMTGNIGERNRTGEQWNSRYDGNDNLLALWKRDSDDPSNQKNFDFNLNYKYDLKNDRGNLVVDLNQSIGNERILGNYYQNDYSADSVLLGSQALQQYLNNNEKNNITTGQIDFTYLFPKINARFETGAKAIIRQQSVNTYSESMDTLLGYVKEDTLANFNYAYDEQVYSAYGIFGQQLGKFKYQAGVRLEQAYQIPNLISDTVRIVNNYFNIFPSGHIRYILGGKSEVSLSYSRRINRAASSDLNPFTSYADPYNLRKGNPYLQPEFIDSYDLGYTNEIKKVNFTTSVFYRHTTGVITRVKDFYADNTSAITFANIDQSHSAGAEAVFIVKPFKWWRNNLSFNANYTKYVDDNPTSNWNVGGFNWNLKYSTTIDFWKRTASIQINAAYNAPRVTIQGTAQRRGPIDVSFEKTFNEGKISLGMRVSDVFNRQGFYMQIDQENIRQYSEFKWLTRRYYLTFTYKFGKLEMTNKRSSGGEGGFEM